MFILALMAVAILAFSWWAIETTRGSRTPPPIAVLAAGGLILLLAQTAFAQSPAPPTAAAGIPGWAFFGALVAAAAVVAVALAVNNYQVIYGLGVFITLLIFLLGVIQTAAQVSGQGDVMGLGPQWVAWCGAAGTFLGAANGFLARVTRTPAVRAGENLAMKQSGVREVAAAARAATRAKAAKASEATPPG